MPKRARLNLRVEYKWKKNLKSIAVRSGKTETEIVERAVDTYIEEHWHDLQPEPIEVVK